MDLVRKFGCSLTLWLAFSGTAFSQHQPILLWSNGAPGSEGKTAPEAVEVTPDGEHSVSGVHHPSITPYLPAKGTANGAAVIIAPGGGHYKLSIDHEGYNVARWMSAHGVAAFVLKYRLARETGSTYTVERDELADIQRALRTVRNRSSEWEVDPNRIGVMGFSAGGELALLASTRSTAKTPNPHSRSCYTRGGFHRLRPSPRRCRRRFYCAERKTVLTSRRASRIYIWR
jgi:acetyl esterase/lipase